MMYRADIDGLRAVAVSSVVLYHCGFAHYVPGGYVGVDVFFVISGFLIAGILKREIERDQFTLAGFYNRRVRRIFPAVFAVYAAILSYAVLVSTTMDVRDICNNIIASVLFVSNIYLYQIYPDASTGAHLNPLLHTWSLSVEEQFYLVLPAFLYVLLRWWPSRALQALFALAATSLAAAAAMVWFDQSAVFFLLPFRAWELLLGVIMAFLPMPRRERWVDEVSGLVGLGLIGVSVLGLRGSTMLPALVAIPSCVGTALVLIGRNGVARALLELPPLRLLGLASYSLYLWHWPIWVLGRGIETSSPLSFLSFIAVSMAFALFSWAVIERPFRTKPYYFGPEKTLVLSGGAMAAILLGTVGVLLFWQE